tara:strand:- start:392 stop:595 length:204 start_codon:yes stop_codon:yes gene_type:complete
MKLLFKKNLLSNNLIAKRNFFVNLLIFSSLAYVIAKNYENIRYTEVISENNKVYILDRFSSKIKKAD